MHFSDKDGARCRAYAMHNNFMCYRHRDDAIPPVIENEPFLIERLDTPEDIRYALFQVAARLACNHMELKRASQLAHILQTALSTFSRVPKAKPQAAASTTNLQSSVILSEAPGAESKDAETADITSAEVTFPPPHACHSECSEESPNFAPAQPGPQPEHHTRTEEPREYGPDPFPPAELARRKEQELAEAQKEEVIPVAPPKRKFPVAPSCFASPER